MAFLLETSALSAFLQPSHTNHARAQHEILGLPAGSAKFVSVVTLAEMEFGLNRLKAWATANPSARADARVAEVEARILTARTYAPLDISHHTATAYADLKLRMALHVQPNVNSQNLDRWLERWQDDNTGSALGIDENDLWIAAQGKERDFTIITGDRDFELFELLDPDVHAIYVCP